MDISVKAYAKLNITLDVLGKRTDGYHEMKMIMQTVALSDDIEIKTEIGGGISVRTDLKFLPCDERNIVYKAAMSFARETGIDYDGISFDIKKNIPVCAGMAGGSADAAAVLKGLDALYGTELGNEKLMKLGLELGADVPYCIMGGTALAEGIGEILTPLKPIPHCWVLIAKPPFSSSTPVVFSKFDCVKTVHRPDTDGVIKALEEGNLAEIGRRMYNVIEPVVAKERREIEQLKVALISNGALGAALSGTGSTVFGVFAAKEEAELAKRNMDGCGSRLIVTETV